MPFESLRDFVELLDRHDELQKVNGADWNLEMGAITELMWESGGRALLFDNIKDYPDGHRVVTNPFANKKRCLMALDMPLDLNEEEAIERFESRLAGYRPIPPQEVKSAPVTENVVTGDQVDLFKLPAPRWHELDGGRYIGTGCCVIQKDPDSTWVNVGTYRIMLHDRNTTGIFMGGIRDGVIIGRKYWERGECCPVAVSLGPDPMFFLASSGGFGFERGVSEYDVAGYLSGTPVKVIRDEYTGLPIPANSEVVLVGEIPPPQSEKRPEGPFGEFTGYYATGIRPEPVIRVKAVYSRNHPIILGSPPLKPKGPSGYSFALPVKKRVVKRKLLARGITDVLDDCTVSIPGVEVIKIKQKYPGHAAKIGLAAVEVASARIVIVVDDDVDIRSPAEVLWAVGTRCEPETAVEIVKGCKAMTLDPVIPPEKRRKRDLTTSKLMIDACRPYAWANEFSPVNRCSKELRQNTVDKWASLFKGLVVKA